jgi:Fe-S oxidoreductase
MVTLEEQHSTRGRAHMLFELLQGEVVQHGWKDDHVKKSLDFCLSCKACKSECPTNVDIATYRAEFLSHYYDGRRRPLHAYAFGMIDRWLGLAAAAPALANASTGIPLIDGALKRVLHVAPQRRLPRLADVTFHRWAARAGVRTVEAQSDGAAVEAILWIDTFTNYFHPEIGRAALDVLRSAGYSVSIPRTARCCGRPLYDFGMLDRAKAYLRAIIEDLRGPIDAGTPLVVLEPSCGSVFRDELRNLFPDDQRAMRLRSQTVLLSELLESRRTSYQPPALARRVLLHGHCHQKALMKMGHTEAILRKMGVALETPDSGCCGMAGAFGFEADKYAMSQAIGERVLMPAVRQAADDTLIVADGFSCREQIEQATGRRALHLAEVLKMGMGA